MAIKLEKKNKTDFCPIIRIAEKLDDTDKEIFLEAINDKDFAAYSLVLQLRNNGIKISKDSVYNHRNSVCKCQVTDAA